jgi:hypothetical protein
MCALSMPCECDPGRGGARQGRAGPHGFPGDCRPAVERRKGRRPKQPRALCFDLQKVELRGLFVSMCKSEMPMVRAAAFANLASFAQQMEEVHVEAELLPEFAKLAADDAESGAPSARLPTASPFFNPRGRLASIILRGTSLPRA